MSWHLVSGEDRAARSALFKIPPAGERRRLRAGTLVKLILELEGPVRGSERLWVKITECSTSIPRRYAGELANFPVVVDLQHGDQIEFGPEHVIEIDRG